jgi:hypothetical protein
MAVTAETKKRMAYALNNEAAGAEITTVLDVTAGTAEASKALVLGASGEIGTITTATITTAAVTTAAITNATLGRLQVTATAVNAAGSAAGNAANLSYGVNIVAGADNATGVKLPVAVANAVVDVISTVNAKSLLIYPQTNSAISGMGANTAFVLGPTNTGAAAQLQFTTVRLVATNATQWYAMC